jgi:electron transfer flavoprotein alpha subunit
MQIEKPKRRLLALIPLDGEQPLDSAAVLAAAKALSSDFDGAFEAVFIGKSPDDDCARLALDAGAVVTWLARHATLGSAEATDQLVSAGQEALQTLGIARGDEVLVLCAAGPLGEELAARLAIRLGGVPLGRCTHISAQPGSVTAHRAAFGGRAELQLSSTQGPWFAATRGGKAVPGAVPAPAGTGRVERLELQTSLPPVAPTRQAAPGQSRPSLAGARIVVAGGRGMAGEAGFGLLQEVADQMGAALAGTLPTIDAGWVPVSAQVGQSGKFVTPHTYIAVGVSGTLQHMAGVDPESRIIAINKDPDADIFKVAEIGVVASWEELLPALLERLRSTAKPEAAPAAR